MRLPKEKVIMFWAQFSRAEFALKATGYAFADKTGTANADWGKFAQEAARELRTADQPATLMEAVKYLKENPPRRQILKEGPGIFRGQASTSQLSRRH